MKSKLLTRQLPPVGWEKLKGSYPGERQKQNTDIKESLKHLTECVIQMTQEIKEMKLEKLGQSDIESKNMAEKMEKRFQDINLAIPKLDKGDEYEERQEKILSWLTEVCKKVFSIGFNLYESGAFDINKIKAFCSENVLRNLLQFSQVNNLSEKDMGSINLFLEKDLLPYFCQKYPESEEAETSAKFSSDLIERDQLQSNSYDLVFKSKVDFSYQENGNYNSQIMKFLNYIISLPNKVMSNGENQKGKKQKALNQMFFQDMESIFKMVQIQNNTFNMQKYSPKNPLSFDWTTDTSSEKQKQQYQQKVKSYTSYQIGQKLSENFKLFTDLQIESKNLTLKNAEVIRVLTKWCEQLQSCYERQFVLERESPFRMKDGQQRYLPLSLSLLISQKLNQQKANFIEKVREQIKINNNKHQSQFSQQKTHKLLAKLSSGEAMVGEYASYIFKNNGSYLVTYLNTLIHGIMKGLQIYKQESRKTIEDLPQLITFTIGDLMRCKCSSKEKEIIALYKEIQRRHLDPNSGLKIIRVKNRLNKGNKDILMNLLYKGEMVVEMQLAIKSAKSKFIQCSYIFNHYLYELKRAPFGPIMEMCNIWISKDLKSKFYLEKVEKLNKRKKKKQTQSMMEVCCQKSKNVVKVPFRCSVCSCFYFSSSSVQKNTHCLTCGKYTCFLCQLDRSEKRRYQLFKELGGLTFQDFKNIQITQNVPKTGGLILNLKSQSKEGQFFVTFIQSKENYLFKYCEVEDEVQLIAKFDTSRVPDEFLKQNLIFTSEEIQQDISDLNVKSQKAIKKYLTSKYLKAAQEVQKHSIFLVNKSLKPEDLKMKKITTWPAVTSINLSQNNALKDFTKIVQNFPNTQLAVLNSINAEQIPTNMWKNLRILYLQNNYIEDVQNLTQCIKLEQLNLSINSIKILPSSIQNWKHMRILNLNRNKLESLPETIGNLKSLQSIYAVHNKLTILPTSIGELSSLKNLKVLFNELTEIPASIGDLKALQLLDLSSNILAEMPSSIGKLVELKYLGLTRNKLTELPPQIGNLKKLLNLRLRSNAQIKLPGQIGQLESLQFLALNPTNLKQLPNSISKLRSLTEIDASGSKGEIPIAIFALSSLKILRLTNTKCERLPDELGNLKILQQLNLDSMDLKELPDSIGKLQSLILLNIEFNKLVSLPETLGNLKNLNDLNAANNQLTTLPQSIGKLSELNRLSLTSNMLAQVPETLKQVLNLEHLDISKNPLMFPLWIFDFQELQRLMLSSYQIKQADTQLFIEKAISACARNLKMINLYFVKGKEGCTFKILQRIPKKMFTSLEK